MADTRDQAFHELLSRGEVSGPVSNPVVEQVEAELGVSLPDQYRAFLRRYGAAVVPGAAIYGIVEAPNEPPLWSDVRPLTVELRDRRQAGAEDCSFIPVSEDGTGIYFYLNTCAAPRTEVWAVGPGVNCLVSDDLRDFVLGLAKGTLKF
ncbi:hypothetical protein BH11PSE2_BH11PSE2_16860 [soil metagenome]